MIARIVAIPILVVCSLWDVAGAEEPRVGNPPTCPSVQIDLPKTTFRSPGYARAILKSDSVDLVYLGSRAFRVQRETADYWLPTVAEMQASTMADDRRAAYAFANQRLIGIRWSDVGEAKGEGSYIVRAGKYRLVMFYTPEEPAEVNVNWCSAASKEFLLERDGTLYSTQ